MTTAQQARQPKGSSEVKLNGLFVGGHPWRRRTTGTCGSQIRSCWATGKHPKTGLVAGKASCPIKCQSWEGAAPKEQQGGAKKPSLARSQEGGFCREKKGASRKPPPHPGGTGSRRVPASLLGQKRLARGLLPLFPRGGLGGPPGQQDRGGGRPG